MATTPDHYALLVATNSYARFNDLVAPHNDAAALAKVLGDPDTGGYRVQTLLDPALQSVMRKIESFCQDRGPRDVAVLYISGHGQLDPEGRLVFPLTDTDPTSPQSTALSAAWLSQRLQDCRSRSRLLLVDTCFSGAASSALTPPSRISAFEHFGEVGGNGLIILTSANNRQEAFQRTAGQEPTLSIFTHHLVRGLETGEADRNRDGQISVGELFSYLVDAIEADEPVQIPSRAGYQEGDFAVMRARNSVVGPSRPATAGSPASPESLRRMYLRWVRAQTQHLDLSIIEKDFAQNAVDVRRVYSPLSTHSRLSLTIRQHELQDWRVTNAGTGTASAYAPNLRLPREKLTPLLDRLRSGIRARAYGGESFPDGDYPYNLSTADVVALWDRLVLTGAPGTGKTTLARHLAVCLAEAGLGDEAEEREENPYWSLPPLTPVFLRLHDLVSRNFPPIPKPVSIDDFMQYLKGHLARSGLSVGALDEMLFEDFGAGRVLLILDGLDEVPEAHSPDRRAQIVSLVELIAVAYPKTRILVTSRPHAYAGDWVLPGFAHEELAPLSVDQAEQIALNIFVLAYSANENAYDQTFDFVAALGRVREELHADPSLWSSPLLLSLMCALWLRRSQDSAGGSLPTTRGGLYREAVDLLIERWTAKHRRESESLTDLLRISAEDLRGSLERLALTCHNRVDDTEALAAQFTYGDLLDSVLAIDPTARVNTFELAEFLSQRSGLLIELAPNRLAYSHFSFQEHLAACWLTRPELFPGGVQQLMRAAPQRWRDVTDLVAAECQFRGRYRDLAALVLGLLDSTSGGTPEDPHWLCVLVASAVFRRYLYSETTAPDATLCAALRGNIVDTLGADALGAEERAFLGRLLSELGDNRPGVGLTAAGLPDIRWSEPIPVAAGTGVSIDPSAVEISTYTVTNLQFRAFLAAPDGYRNSQWWTEPGLAWSLRLGGPPNTSEEKWSQNYPCADVSWYDARAFTMWLSANLATEIRLPTLAEWQAAAGGPRVSDYPYGDQFDEHANNTAATGMLHPCAVGIFPRGRSPHGPLDLGGNVFEWTSTSWGETGDALPGQADPSYVVCGAAYDSRDLSAMRSAHSFPRRPASRVPQRGFRLARTV